MIAFTQLSTLFAILIKALGQRLVQNPYYVLFSKVCVNSYWMRRKKTLQCEFMNVCQQGTSRENTSESFPGEITFDQLVDQLEDTEEVRGSENKNTFRQKIILKLFSIFHRYNHQFVINMIVSYTECLMQPE